ncbi:MAG: SprB repeat-containing protein, partial [Flavobacteriales bacterium]|nr:SprB repeat-containing protein [Flavobacteriales bacterium]
MTGTPHVFREHRFAHWLAVPLLISLALSASAADSLQISLQVSNYNGYQVSCFGSKDGWIDLSVSGGQSPYHYEWSNGSNEQDLTELAAGYYKVDVLDNDGQRVTKEVTLDQPLAMKLDVDVYEYSNGYNISCYQCSNGNASVVVLGGAPPFTITWSDGPIGADRYNLAAKDYKITAADANGCAGTSTTIYLRGPDRSDWSMSGNAGTTPGPHYMGTPDNKDVVFKSNGQERLRLRADGEIVLPDTSIGIGLLSRDGNGVLEAGGFPTLPPLTPPKCYSLPSYPYWETRGNAFDQLCPDQHPLLGTLSDMDLNIVTNGEQRMRITRNGLVGIGTDPPTGQAGSYRLFVEDGIACRDVLVKLGDWPDFVFQPNYALMPLHEMRQYLRTHKHLPGIPSAAELEAKQG